MKETQNFYKKLKNLNKKKNVVMNKINKQSKNYKKKCKGIIKSKKIYNQEWFFFKERIKKIQNYKRKF